MRTLLIAAVGLVVAGGARAEVTFDWVTVGDPGNAPDIHGEGYGAVDYVYQIGTYEVTNAQYAEFLNAVAATDTYELYNTYMVENEFGGITRGGSSGSYTYSAIAGREDMPVNWVSFWDATRFVNWLHNGQPTGAQDSTTTEDGAYALTPPGIADNSITRNVGATIFLTSEDEWYKAAYYNPLVPNYFDYPTGSAVQTSCALPGATANTANCNLVVWDLRYVGSYTASASRYGTFDPGGNVWEWNEAIIIVISPPHSNRGRRGAAFRDLSTGLRAANRGNDPPTSEAGIVGFRVARIAPPICGNGEIESTEKCDDTGTDPGDGCDASCQIEAGWTCGGEPSLCTENILPALSPWSQLVLAAALIGTGLSMWKWRAA